MKIRKMGKVKKSLTALAAGALLAAGLVVAPQLQTTANAAVIQGWCNTATYYSTASSPYGIGYYVPTLGVGGSRACQMSQGSVSSAVAALQGSLQCNTENDWVGAIDGSWGPQTTTALRDVQSVRGITPDGVYGPQTHNALGTWGHTLVPASPVWCSPDSPI